MYDDTKGKAYSYFGTIAKRYLIVYNNSNYKRLKGKATVEEVDEDKTILNELVLTNENNLEELEFIDIFISYVDENLLEIFTKIKRLGLEMLF